MKQTLRVMGILLLTLLVIGCVTRAPTSNETPLPTIENGEGEPTQGEWYYYAPVQAQTNPWQTFDVVSVTTLNEIELVQTWLGTVNVFPDVVVFIPHDEIVCEALNCPRGDYLLVHVEDAAHTDTLLENGFHVMNEPFVYATPGNATGYTVTLVNAGNETIYFGGCNDYTLRKITPQGNDVQQGNVCVWEGIPTSLEAGKTISFAGTLTTNGAYDVIIEYGTGCDAQLTLSQANCEEINTLSSNVFSIQGAHDGQTISMTYELTQCLTNPWQDPETPLSAEEDLLIFTEWASAQGIPVLHATSIPPAPNLAVCLACSCASGEKYRIVIEATYASIAEDAGFTLEGDYAWPLSIPQFSEATWRMYIPNQCYANIWKPKGETVRSIEKDVSLMKEWLEGQGAQIQYLAVLRGLTLAQECLKKSNDRYGIGVTDEESSILLEELGFVLAGPQQLKLFTDTTDTESLELLYKTKFCDPQPWEQPDLVIGNEEEVAERVHEWMADMGIASYEKPTIHKVNPSATGTCGTDAGLAVVVNVPAWSDVHLAAYGFQPITPAFNKEKSQIYPVIPVEEI